ncbi:MAG: tetratricopeptide repeat protein, partial [Isosphaeraceae bacterium]
RLDQAEKANPQAVEAVALFRVDLLSYQGRRDEARAVLTAAQAKDPRNLNYRLALAQLAQNESKTTEAMQILDQAAQDLGPNLRIELARLGIWAQHGGPEAKAAVAKLAGLSQKLADADRSAFLDRLSLVEAQLGSLDQARQHERELAALRPSDINVRLRLFDLAIAGGDQKDADDLVGQIRKLDGEKGTVWRFARAALLIDQVRRGDRAQLAAARQIAADLVQERPQWAGGYALSGEIAELAGEPVPAIAAYQQAVKLGDLRPALVRRLVGLLNEQKQFDEIDRVARLLPGEGAAVPEITLVKALEAIRKEDFDKGVALARQVYSESSTNASDHLNMGRIYLAAGRTDEAGKLFRRAVELGPGASDAWLAYVQFLVQTKQPDQAKAATEAARKALPADRATLTLARCALIMNDLAQAEKLVEQALSDEGRSADPATLQLAATIALGRNQRDKAGKYLDQLEGLAGASAADKAWVNRTRALMLLTTNRQADRDKALRLVDQNLAQAPESVEDLSLKVSILSARASQRPEATAILERLAAAGRLGDDQRFLLAQLYLGQGQEPKYQAEMLGLLNRKVKDPRYLAHFVNHWIDQNQLDQADRWLAELKKVDPKGLPALELEARLLDLRKRRPELLALLEAHGRDVPDDIGPVADLLNRYKFAKEAEAAYKAYIARDPKQPERVLALARFLARQDRVSEAMSLFNSSWSNCPRERVALAALPLYNASSAGPGEKARIKSWLEEVARKRPDSTLLEGNLGTMLYKEGKFDESEAVYRRVLDIDPYHIESLNNLAWMLALREPRRLDEAFELISRARKAYGAIPSLLGTSAVISIEREQLDEALSELRAARAANPANPFFPFFLAWVLHEKGNEQEAVQELRAADGRGLDTAAAADRLLAPWVASLRKSLGAAQGAQRERK